MPGGVWLYEVVVDASELGSGVGDLLPLNVSHKCLASGLELMAPQLGRISHRHALPLCVFRTGRRHPPHLHHLRLDCCLYSSHLAIPHS